jgi:hypothetical protein
MPRNAAISLGKPGLVGHTADVQALNKCLLKMRAVLLLVDAPRGSKVVTADALAEELRVSHLMASKRSLYRWCRYYRRYGLIGLVRRRRNDRGRPQSFEADMLASIVDAAKRVRRHGDLAREFRNFKGLLSYPTFLFWIRRIKRQCKVREIPVKEATVALLF